MPRFHRLRVAQHHRPDLLPPLPGRPAFPVRPALVRWDVEDLGAQLRRGSHLASKVGCRSGLDRQGDERVRPREVRDPYPPPVRLAVVERADPHIDEVVRGTLS